MYSKLFAFLLVLLTTPITHAAYLGGLDVPANKVFAGPTSGGNAPASFRSIVAADLPAVSVALTSAHIFVGSGANLATDVAVSGDLTLINTGAFTVATVGLSSAANIHSAELLANAAVSTNTVSTIVKRDGSGNFAAGTITASLSGNSTTATALAANPSDCSAGQFATTIAANGDLTCAQVAFSNLSGTATVAQMTIAAQAIGASAIDWSTGNVFTKTLGANTTFTFSNQTSGQVIVVRLTNTASNYTVTWPVGVLWSGGSAPVETIGAKSDVITFVYDGTNTYGSSVQNF